MEAFMLARTKYREVDTTATVVPTTNAVTTRAIRLRRLDRSHDRGFDKVATANFEIGLVLDFARALQEHVSPD